MTYTKKTLVLPVLIVLISILGVTAQNAMAVTSTVHDKLSCQSPPIGGVWNSITSTCTVSTLVIVPTDKVVIASNANFNIGTVTSSGVIVNVGRINIASGGVITTSGAFSNQGIIASTGGTITNSGPFKNFGTITSSGKITNNPTGVIQSSGSITSSGVITSSGTLQVNGTGLIFNNGGTLTNTLNVINKGAIMTFGTFTNSGPVMNTGDIINKGLMTNSNTITNIIGSIFNLCGGSVVNSGTISGHTVKNTCVV